MKHLLEAINKGILKGLYENNIELLADLDVDNLDLLDSLLVKSINKKDSYILIVKLRLIDSINARQISGSLKEIINNPNNYNRFKGLIKATNKDHLLELILIGYKLFGYNGNFNWIDTSSITDMSELFKDSVFNGDISLWDVSNVTNMSCMFCCAYKFNLPIGNWNVSNVTTMFSMFYCAEKFNLPLNNWTVRDNVNISYVFKGCPIKEEYKFAWSGN